MTFILPSCGFRPWLFPFLKSCDTKQESFNNHEMKRRGRRVENDRAGKRKRMNMKEIIVKLVIPF